MRLVVGLGNYNLGYENTRHNTGFIIVEGLARRLGPATAGWCLEGDLGADVWRSREGLVLAKPRVAMNSSGAVVRDLRERFRVVLEDILLVHDDLDIPVGAFKLQREVGSAGHRGVESVISVLGSGDFWRLRVGIGRPPEGVAVEDYVLGELSESELELLEGLVEGELIDVVREWVTSRSKIEMGNRKHRLKT